MRVRPVSFAASSSVNRSPRNFIYFVVARAPTKILRQRRHVLDCGVALSSWAGRIQLARAKIGAKTGRRVDYGKMTKLSARRLPSNVIVFLIHSLFAFRERCSRHRIQPQLTASSSASRRGVRPPSSLVNGQESSVRSLVCTWACDYLPNPLIMDRGCGLPAQMTGLRTSNAETSVADDRFSSVTCRRSLSDRRRRRRRTDHEPFTSPRSTADVPPLNSHKKTSHDSDSERARRADEAEELVASVFLPEISM